MSFALLAFEAGHPFLEEMAKEQISRINSMATSLDSQDCHGKDCVFQTTGPLSWYTALHTVSSHEGCTPCSESQRVDADVAWPCDDVVGWPCAAAADDAIAYTHVICPTGVTKKGHIPDRGIMCQAPYDPIALHHPCCRPHLCQHQQLLTSNRLVEPKQRMNQQ